MRVLSGLRTWLAAARLWFRRCWCGQVGHDPEQISVCRYEVTMDALGIRRGLPAPVPGYVLIERPGNVLHPIAEIEERQLRCTRCGQEWEDQKSMYGDPIVYSTWLMFQVEGIVILPATSPDERGTDHEKNEAAQLES